MPSTSRKFTAAAVAAVLAFTGAACSGGDDDADPVGGEVEDRGDDDGVTGTDDADDTDTDDTGDTGDDADDTGDDADDTGDDADDDGPG